MIFEQIPFCAFPSTFNATDITTYIGVIPYVLAFMSRLLAWRRLVTHIVSPMQPLPQTQAVVNSVRNIVVILPLFVSIQTVSLCKIVKQIVEIHTKTTQQMTITIKFSAIHTIYFVDIDAHAHERSFIYKSKLDSIFARRN